jgi:inner membrane protein
MLIKTGSFRITFATLDSLTHIVLGACIGEAIAGKKLGKRAMLAGAVAQSIPDVDFLSTFWLRDAGDIIGHRGFTHSILFGILATIFLSWIARTVFRGNGVPWKTWFLLIGVNVATHLFIDGFNAYGVGWLEPFSHKRFSFHVLFVADPFFSFWPFLGFMALLVLRQRSSRRKLWWKLGIGISTVYLLYATVNKLIVQADVRRNLAAQHIAADNYIVTPTPFNSWLWFVAAKDKGGYYISHRSVFDKKEGIRFMYFPQNDSLQKEVKNQKELGNMIRFADHFYTLERKTDTIQINVLRFGQIVGWYDPEESFTFYYYFDHPGSNKIVAQRGRFKRWNRETILALWRRVKGNKK